LGEVQADHALSSRRHTKVGPDSDEENSKLALVERAVPEGPEVMEVSGTVVSTVRGRLSSEKALRAAFMAWTSIRQSPSSKGGVV
jgi:hypothetical protein